MAFPSSASKFARKWNRNHVNEPVAKEKQMTREDELFHILSSTRDITS